MHVVILRVVTLTSETIVEADTIGEAEEIAEAANETEWSTPRREQRIFPIGATGV